MKSNLFYGFLVIGLSVLLGVTAMETPRTPEPTDKPRDELVELKKVVSSMIEKLSELEKRGDVDEDKREKAKKAVTMLEGILKEMTKPEDWEFVEWTKELELQHLLDEKDQEALLKKNGWGNTFRKAQNWGWLLWVLGKKDGVQIILSLAQIMML